MLSLESSVLTRLILERHTSICRAIQLDAKCEVLALLKALAHEEGPAAVTTIGADECISRRLSEITTERALLPFFVAELERRIDTAWARLDQVSPNQRPCA